MASKVAEAFVAIKANAEGLKDGMDKAEGATVSKTTTMAQRVGGVLKGGLNVAYGGVGLAAKASAGIASVAWKQAQTTLARAKEAAGALSTAFKVVGAALVGIALTADTSGVRVNAMLRGSGQAAGFSRDQLEGMAKGIAEASGSSQRLVREAQAVMLSFGAVRGDTFKEAMKSVPELAAHLGIELPQAAQRFGQALQDPAHGLDLLKSLGQTITPVMTEAFTRAAEGSQQGWVRAQQYILQAVQRASKGSAKELDGTLAGAVSRLKNGFIDMADGFAPVLVPAAQALVGIMQRIKAAVEANKPAFEAFGKGLAKGLEVVGVVIGGVINVLGQVPKEVWAGVAAFAGIAMAAAAFGAVVAKFIVFIKPIAALVLTILNPLNLVMGAVVALGVAVAYAFNTERWGGRVQVALKKIIETAQSLWETIQTLGTVIWTRVQPAWDAFVERAVTIFGAIAGFIKDNEETWNEWFTLIGEIVGGVISTIIQIWDGFVSVIQAGIGWIGENTVYTWENIKAVVTGVLDWLSLVFANFKLSLEIAWTAISYGAQVAWDKIKYAFMVTVAALYGSGQYMSAAFEAIWNNILAAGERMGNRLRALFYALGQAATAIFRGKNPVTEFREAYEKEVSRLDGRSKQFKNVGEAAASSYKKGYERVMQGMDGKETEAARKLREKLGEANGELNAQRNARRAETQAELERRRRQGGAAAAQGGSQGGTDSDTMQGNPAAIPNMVKVKFETVGLKDMWKQMQEKMTGGSMLQLQQQTAKATGEMNRETKQQTDILRNIDRGVREPKPAVAG